MAPPGGGAPRSSGPEGPARAGAASLPAVSGVWSGESGKGTESVAVERRGTCGAGNDPVAAWIPVRPQPG